MPRVKKLASTLLIATALGGLSGIVAGANAATHDFGYLGLYYDDVDTQFYSSLTDLGDFASDLAVGLFGKQFTVSQLDNFFQTYNGGPSPFVTALSDTTNWFVGMSFSYAPKSSTVTFSGVTNLGDPADGKFTVAGGRAVPGPVVGSGLLGALSLLGFAAWRRRYGTAA